MSVRKNKPFHFKQAINHPFGAPRYTSRAIDQDGVDTHVVGPLNIVNRVVANIKNLLRRDPRFFNSYPENPRIWFGYAHNG